MHGRLVFELPPSPDNSRNSEGAFIRMRSGATAFAYSRYNSAAWGDDADCDIAVIYSYDEGESWSEPEIIARAVDFGTKNLMSVSSLILRDGGECFLFLIKEQNGTITLGRSVYDGEKFVSSRCGFNCHGAYYVVNNDRALRLSDGRVVMPAARHTTSGFADGFRRFGFDSNAVAVCLVSEDDGASFYCAPARVMLNEPRSYTGMQEPGLCELPGGVLWMYARTDCGAQYEAFSFDGMRTFTPARQSRFTSPASPMKVAEHDGVYYAVWNPVPNYVGRKIHLECGGRTPLALSASTDGCKTWSAPVYLEDDADRGYCYPAVYFTSDAHVLLAYCRGSVGDGSCLVRTGILKFAL